MKALQAHLFQRFASMPVMLEAQELRKIEVVGVQQLRVDPMAFGPQALEGAGPTDRSACGYDVIAGVAVIGVRGVLVQRLGTLRPWGDWVTGYDGIRANLLMALADPEVKAIAFSIASPGGEVSGCFDLADTIHAARGDKPIWAICAEDAYSAAYAIASACDHITVPRTGGVGSIGVIAMLVDFSQALAEGGIAVHFIHHGARKAEVGRAQYEGVKPDLLKRLQVEIDAVGELFVETVARNRGIPAKSILALEAACVPALTGQALKTRLADAVMAPDEAFQALVTSLG